MKVVHSPLHARHDGGKELHRGELVPCFEMPARADFILQALVREGFEVSGPRPFALESLSRVHDAGFIEFLRTAHAEWRAIGVERRVAVVRHRVPRLLERRGVLPAEGPENALEAQQAASLRQQLPWAQVEVRAPPRRSPRWAQLEGHGPPASEGGRTEELPAAEVKEDFAHEDSSLNSENEARVNKRFQGAEIIGRLS